ncbi:acyl-CoA dehydrogenase family protein [Nocardioides panacisoli]|uniref:acyl-CoA dehydrogenase family protein n=1 Tax=Nocardioides panacisoli TaxID=627624 RepID=UPI001C62669F|nr:acyl-CoA dehydrogenase family protein [Nocardioides panacisoli]QYJ03186.1 acyl-CoA dehydrogenase family protein [Nocardioides panacisoli]
MTVSTMFTEPEERVALREAVAKLAASYGREYVEKQARADGKMTEMWLEMGRHGFLGVNLPEEYGGGGGGMADLAAVLEEAAAAGAPLLMMVVSPAICGSIIARCGTEEQKRQWLPSIADGSHLMAFGITEADAGSNSHQITTTATRDGDEWVLKGQKTFISGVDEAQSVLIVARTADERTGKLKPALFVVPTDATGFDRQVIPMAWEAPEKQFTLFLDDVRVPDDALVGGSDNTDAGLWQLFAGLNPERIMGGAMSCGTARYALSRAVEYANQRSVWKDQPIGSHQAIAHPLAKVKIELEQARMLWQKAAALYDAGDDFTAGEYANMAKYAGGEIACNATDAAVHTHGGNGLTQEYGLANMMVAARLGRIAPVSREMILNFVAMHSLGLPKSY